MAGALIFCLIFWGLFAQAILEAWLISPMLALTLMLLPIAFLVDLVARAKSVR